MISKRYIYIELFIYKIFQTDLPTIFHLQKAQEDFVEMRRVGGQNVSADDLHLLLVLARYYNFDIY